MAGVSRQTQEKLASKIYESKLLEFGEFTLKSDIVSPFYLDFRKAQSHPLTFRAIVDAYAEMIEGTDESTFIAGVPEAATPIAGALGYSTKRPLLQPRKITKGHGTKNTIEGDFEEGDAVVLIDDLITKGGSKLEIIEQVEQAGLEIEKFIVLVDREHGGMETVQEAGYDIQAAFTISALVNTLYGEGVISQSSRELVLDFVRDN